MTSKHLQFCLNYLQTHDTGVAYKMTYPKANNHSVYAAASRLMARADVQAWIRETEQRVQDRVLWEVVKEQGDELKGQLLSINEKRTVLTKIITGETKRVRHVKTKYSYQKVEDDLPIYAVLRAIDMDTRLESFYNYLTNPETCRKTQNLYINTPTLQQQVNILIAQTTDKKEENTSTIENSTLERGEGVCPLAQEDTQQELSPEQETTPSASAGEGGKRLTQNSSPLERGEGVCTLASKNTPQPNDTRSVSPPKAGGKGEDTQHELSTEEQCPPPAGVTESSEVGGGPFAQKNTEHEMSPAGAVSASGARGDRE